MKTVKGGIRSVVRRVRSQRGRNRWFSPSVGAVLIACAFPPTTPRAPSEKQAAAGSRVMTELKSRHLFTITMKLHPTLELGETPWGRRRVFTVSGGEFLGDRLRGEVLPQASSDLLLVRGDLSSQLDVRLILRTDDRSLILMTYRGVRHASAGADDRIARGEQVEASEYYLRTAPFFETSSPKYAWLNKIVSVGVGERRPDGVTYEIFEIL